MGETRKISVNDEIVKINVICDKMSGKLKKLAGMLSSVSKNLGISIAEAYDIEKYVKNAITLDSTYEDALAVSFKKIKDHHYDGDEEMNEDTVNFAYNRVLDSFIIERAYRYVAAFTTIDMLVADHIPVMCYMDASIAEDMIEDTADSIVDGAPTAPITSFLKYGKSKRHNKWDSKKSDNLSEFAVRYSDVATAIVELKNEIYLVTQAVQKFDEKFIDNHYDWERTMPEPETKSYVD